MICPRCEYDLTGLPEQHLCPECGFPYDADEEVFCVGQKKRTAVLTVISIGLNTLNTGFWCWFGARKGVFSAPLAGFLMLAMLSIGIVAATKKLRGGRMLVGPKGIRFEPAWKGCSALTWENLSEVRCSVWDGSLLFHDPTGFRFLRCPISQHKDLKRFRSLAAEVNRRIRLFESERLVQAATP